MEPTVTDRSPVVLRGAVRLPNQISSVFDALSFSQRDAHRATTSLTQEVSFCRALLRLELLHDSDPTGNRTHDRRSDALTVKPPSHWIKTDVKFSR